MRTPFMHPAYNRRSRVNNLISGLAAKITLPFVALFALLLLALGWILAREILSDVEARVENEQRFVLEVAAFPDVGVGDDSLRQIRDRAQGHGESRAAGRSEFIVLQKGATPLTTLLHDKPAEQALYDAFLAELSAHPQLEPRSEDPRLERVRLASRDFLLLSKLGKARGSGASVPRRFFLLHPYSEIEQAKNRALWRIVSLGAAGLALAAGLGLVLANWIARPVRKLAAAAQRVTHGGLNEALDPLLAGGKEK